MKTYNVMLGQSLFSTMCAITFGQEAEYLLPNLPDVLPQYLRNRGYLT
jgi:hypothetical protein